ncbi:peptide ABC transporter substrate-binding protein [Rathayibacter toxicus]|uniref:peptide ABC transporter substrate-binding protein n=1 Tax=Rathayibacter toxicus TaxID=145458 RepID=UPI001C056316|nr:ABC transporter substrate-binding protein [Rathayibacter toxicus]QWL29884.1 ABC transporter substrate-binding protein [Rathayibacter toxicus]
MNIRRYGFGALALVAASTLVLAGCSGSGSSGNGASGSNPAAIISTNGSEPQNPLIPTNTNETGGGLILDQIFAGLVVYDAKGRPQNDGADSIKSDDSQNYTIKLKSGQKFTNGEPVTAHSFVDAWNYGAKASNKQRVSSFFSNIQGYSETQDSELTGLKVVDDTTFTVALNAPQSDFPLSLGYSAFYPLPAAAFADMAAFGQKPIGNGPYKLDGDNAWKHNVEIDLVTNKEYSGPRAPKNGGLKINFYATLDAAYSDLLGGNVDVIDKIPDSAFATFKGDLGDRAVNQPAAYVQSFTIPQRLAHFSGEEGRLRRRAISLAFDRKEIAKVIFDNTRTPAVDFTSPVIDGWTDKLSGADVLTYSPDEAKKLWAQADAISPWSGTFTLAYNADGGHQGWVDAVTNSIKNTLGITAQGEPDPTFAQLRTKIVSRSIQTAFRSGWQADYPSLNDFLRPNYVTGGSSNDGDYSNPEFDSLVAAGLSDTNNTSANQKFQQAQEILLKDLPVLPLWYQNVTAGFGTSVANVKFGWDSVPLFYQITKN